MAKKKPAVARRGVPDWERQIGEAIRGRRYELGVTQTSLADSLGVTFQQIQKYERGVNRVAATRLYQISLALDCSMKRLMPFSS